MTDVPTNAVYPQYRVEPQSFWYVGKAAGADGVATMAVAAQFGWRAIGSWGSGGWDLGAWPAALIYHRDRYWPNSFELVEWVDGDVTMWSFPTRDLRKAATDRIAFMYWKQREEPWVSGVLRAEEMPEQLRGPYSPERSRHDLGVE